MKFASLKAGSLALTAGAALLLAPTKASAVDVGVGVQIGAPPPGPVVV